MKTKERADTEEYHICDYPSFALISGRMKTPVIGLELFCHFDLPKRITLHNILNLVLLKLHRLNTLKICLDKSLQMP